MENKEPALRKIMKFFKIGLNKDFKNAVITDKIKPIEKIDPKSYAPVKFSPQVERFWKYWMNDCHTYAEDYKRMVAVWEDMDLLYYNDVLMKRSIDLYTDETIQADLNPEYISIEASPKVKDFLLDFHDRISLYSKLRPIIEDVVQYGNAGLILSQNENSIEEIIQPNIYDFKAILEFTPTEIEKKINGNDKFLLNYCSSERIDKLVQSIIDKDNYSSYFKKYTLGYQIGEYVLPPWRFLHFKNATSKSPFDPYGVPMLIHSVSTYRQWDAAMTLQMALRAAKLPIEKYEITASNVVDPVSKLQMVTDFLRNIQNSGFSNTRKEDKGVGEAIFTIKELFDYDLIVPDIDLGKIEDIEMLYNDKIISTGIPRELIDPNDSGFGASGISLIQQFKPFARQIYRQQSIVLENISQMDKIEMILSNQFSEDEMDFTLSMPYPESQINEDVISSQESLLDLADKTIELLSDKFLNGEPLPPELTYAIIDEILPYSSDRIDKWIDQIKNSKMSNIEDIAQNTMYEMKKEFNKNKNKNKITKIIKKQKIKYLKEGIGNNKHYFSSYNKNPVFNSKLLNEWSIDDTKNLLKEETKSK